MQYTSTQLHLLLYIYNELSAEEMEEIKESIHSDESVNREYQELLITLKLLDKIEFKPSSKTLNKIFNYCRITGNMKSNNCGDIELTYN